MGSNIDCRDTEDVSVLLLSNVGKLLGFGPGGGAECEPEWDGWALPVKRSLLKPSTSSDARAFPVRLVSAVGRLEVYSLGSLTDFGERPVVDGVFANGL